MAPMAEMYGETFVKNLQDALAANTYSGELLYSRAVIMQPTSPEVAGQSPGYEAGQIVDNVSREILSSCIIPPWLLAKGIPANKLQTVNTVNVIPVMKLPSEFILWKNRDTEGVGFHWKTLDRNDPRVRAGVWKKSGGTYGTKPGQEGAPPVTENCNWLLLMLDPESQMPIGNFIVMTFARTSARCGTKFTTAVNSHGFAMLPPWGFTYWLYTRREKNEIKNAFYYELDLARGAKLTNPQLNKLCAATAGVLSDPTPTMDGKSTAGYDAQVNMINAAAIEDAANAGDGQVLDAQAQNVDAFGEPIGNASGSEQSDLPI